MIRSRARHTVAQQPVLVPVRPDLRQKAKGIDKNSGFWIFDPDQHCNNTVITVKNLAASVLPLLAVLSFFISLYEAKLFFQNGSK